MLVFELKLSSLVGMLGVLGGLVIAARQSGLYGPQPIELRARNLIL
jgi:hypothetical protein